mmetsp:Transcript_35896/g.73764  ORF Transcript_35896/g.73764 Transcript_35896/m.73764 type:complete len:209 (+) Transcript_35896:518-1144(+)
MICPRQASTERSRRDALPGRVRLQLRELMPPLARSSLPGLVRCELVFWAKRLRIHELGRGVRRIFPLGRDHRRLLCLTFLPLQVPLHSLPLSQHLLDPVHGQSDLPDPAGVDDHHPLCPRFVALYLEAVALLEKDPPQFVEIFKRLQPQFVCPPCPADCWVDRIPLSIKLWKGNEKVVEAAARGARSEVSHEVRCCAWQDCSSETTTS